MTHPESVSMPQAQAPGMEWSTAKDRRFRQQLPWPSRMHEARSLCLVVFSQKPQDQYCFAWGVSPSRSASGMQNCRCCFGPLSESKAGCLQPVGYPWIVGLKEQTGVAKSDLPEA